MTSRTSPETMTQQSSLVLCLATSSVEYEPVEVFFSSGTPAPFSVRSSTSVPATVESPSFLLMSCSAEETAVDGADDEDEADEDEPSTHSSSILAFDPGATMTLAWMRWPATAPRRSLARWLAKV